MVKSTPELRTTSSPSRAWCSPRPDSRTRCSTPDILCRLAEGLELLDRAGKREIGEIGDIGGAHAAQRRGPGLGRFPVEGCGGIARSAADGQALGLQPGGDAAAGLAGGADDEDGFGLTWLCSLARG